MSHPDEFNPTPANDPNAPPPVVDPEAERRAFLDLIAHLKDNPEDGAEITILPIDDFMAESFTPPAGSNPDKEST